MNDASRNETHCDLGVNCLEDTEINPKGETRTVSGVTDQPLNDPSIMAVMRAGRSRWKIENETFQTVKTARGSGLSTLMMRCGSHRPGSPDPLSRMPTRPRRQEAKTHSVAGDCLARTD
ncbi:MAG: hypothetical protein OXD33_14945 [Rhodobacteraceae bacterium]|nr:hypothetical protein [Paracoccaceae bacterium]